MKKSCLILCLLLSTICSFALNEKVCVVTNTGSTGQACTASNLGFVDPCSALGFVVNYEIPVSAGYVIVAKYEWFVNGASVKTTTNPSDPVLFWQIKAATTNVFCKVTYKKQDGTLSQAFPSNTFTPNVKSLNFASIVAATAPPNYGCTTNPVSYSLNTYTCSGGLLCSSVFNTAGTPYQISWQPPSGWTQTSISANGNNVSFLPDATTGGTLTATISLPCGFTETRTFTISRGTEKPTFLSPPSLICSSSSNFSINSICGAVDYTYNIVGHAGITFAANGQQTLTTNSTTVNLNVSGTGSTFSLKAKTNFPNGFVSQDATTQSSFGVPVADNITSGSAQGSGSMQGIDFYYNGQYPYWDNNIEPTKYFEFESLDGHYIYGNPPNELPQNPPFNAKGVSVSVDVNSGSPYNISLRVRAYNSCGVSDWQYFEIPLNGQYYYRISPNPAKDIITISEKKESISANAGKKIKAGITEVRIFDNMGILKKQVSYSNGAMQAQLNIPGLTTGIYFVEISSGQYKERQQLVIQN